MADRITKERRSKNMSAVRGKGNKTTELRMGQLFREHRVTGWRRHLTNLPGRPDFAFPQQKIAVFVDGCFWHGCSKCSNLIPSSNQSFWKKKIEQNTKRDKKASRDLKQKGWKVIRVWEHELKTGIPVRLKKIYAESRPK